MMEKKLIFPCATMNLCATEWIYRAEGNNNIVFSNKTNSCLLRLAKTSQKNRKSKQNILEEQLSEIDFLQSVIYKLLDKYRIHFRAQKVHLNRKFLEDLTKSINETRPKCLRPHMLDFDCEYGLIMQNFCKLLCLRDSNASSVKSSQLPAPRPIISVEIRPKSCYVPSLPADSHPELFKKCHFCLNKLAEQIRYKTPQTMYCPFDLYSQDIRRMKRALKDLMKQPQRYISIRINDHLVDLASVKQSLLPLLSVKNKSSGEEIESFYNLVCNALLTPLAKHCLPSPTILDHCRRPDDTLATFTCRENQNDHQGTNIMQFLSYVSSMPNATLGDAVDAELRLLKYLSHNPRESQELSLSFPYEEKFWQVDGHTLGKEMFSTKKSFEVMNDVSITTPNAPRSKTEALQIANELKRFIISRTFNCCSLILSFQLINQDDEVICNGGMAARRKVFVISDGFGSQYLASIAILDMYKDPPNQLTKYYHNEQRLISCLQRFYNNPN